MRNLHKLLERNAQSLELHILQLERNVSGHSATLHKRMDQKLMENIGKTLIIIAIVCIYAYVSNDDYNTTVLAKNTQTHMEAE